MPISEADRKLISNLCILGMTLVVVIGLTAKFVFHWDPEGKKIAELQKQLDRNRTSSLAFLGFTNNNPFMMEDKTDVVIFLTELGDHKYAVVERDEVYLKRIFRELKFNLSESVDKTTAKKFGRILGVDAVVIGKVRSEWNDRDLYLRFIDTETGRIIWAGELENVLKTLAQ